MLKFQIEYIFNVLVYKKSLLHERSHVSVFSFLLFIAVQYTHLGILNSQRPVRTLHMLSALSLKLVQCLQTVYSSVTRTIPDIRQQVLNK